ncbi:hypothetical protein V9T40_004772 [Parthenolecanium corni]|uniref:Uncharacterized protein n=1 Tax=Parthenolecanium corni TaxID=536013 RepID=A0AAN9TEP5_9HEMI
MTSRTRQIRRIVGGEGKANESEALGMERGCAAQPPCWQRASHRSATRTRLAYFFVLLGRWQPPRVTRAVHTPRSAAGSRQQAVGCLAHYIRPQVRTIRIDREMPTSIAALAPKIARILFGIRLYLERDPRGASRHVTIAERRLPNGRHFRCAARSLALYAANGQPEKPPQMAGRHRTAVEQRSGYFN